MITQRLKAVQLKLVYVRLPVAGSVSDIQN